MRALMMATAAVASASPGSTGAPPIVGQEEHPLDRRTLGREQSDPWIPVEMLAATSLDKRRDLMLDHIRREVGARNSSIDASEVEHVLGAMRTFDRERFVPHAQRRFAYLPASVDIGHGQTLSDPYLVTVMLAAARIRSGMRILDVGTGSGYQAALLDRLGGQVTSIEIVPALASEAATRLRRLGFARIRVVTGDGALGYRPAAPFDVIIVAAGATDFPARLIEQLAPGGRLIMPIGPTQAAEQLLLARKREDGTLDACSLGLAAAVPLTGNAAAIVPREDVVTRSWCFGRPVT